MSSTHATEFGPITEPLNALFEDNPFEWWHTGGGCTAIQAMLAGDITVTITDSTDTPQGEEAFITGMRTRIANGGDGRYGYTVGVYDNEGCDLLVMEDCFTVADLPGLVASLLIQAVHARWRFTPPGHSDSEKGAPE